jgi:hypothetical protein
MMLMLSISALGVWAENQDLTQMVCIGNQPYRVDVSALPSPTYHWSITPGNATNWQINGSSNAINIDWLTAGSYTLSVYSSSNGCDGPVQSLIVNVTAPPTANISYVGSPWCTTAIAQTVTLTGTGAYTGGIYSSTAGLSINASTGAIDPSISTAGTYTVTYTTVAAGGCGVVTATTSITITALPTASISYVGSPWCTTATAQTVTLTGTGAYTGGIYSSTAGLSINASTGAIDPSLSTAGTYTVTYTTVAGSGCGVVTATTSITIYPISTTSPIWHN